MERIGFGYSKTSDVCGYLYALKCDNRFYVITKRQYTYAQRKTKKKKPFFYTELPVFIDGINI